MTSTAAFAEIAALAGDPARAAMLHALMDGRALTATELAAIAGVTPQTASGHLARLVTAGLLAVEKQGRHRYYRLASAAVAGMVETLMVVAATVAPPLRPVATGPRDAALRRARTCYDHLAGRLGVALCDALVARGAARVADDGAELTEDGRALLAGLAVALPRPGGRVYCRPCLDWSERRPHLAGAVGAALCRHGFDHGWIRRMAGTRAVEVTPLGGRMFREHFGVTL